MRLLRSSLLRGYSWVLGETHLNHPSAQQIVAARALLGLSQHALAVGAWVSLSTIRRFEATATEPDASSTMRLSTMVAIVVFFTSQGVEFRDEGDKFGVLVARK